MRVHPHTAFIQIHTHKNIYFVTMLLLCGVPQNVQPPEADQDCPCFLHTGFPKRLFISRTPAELCRGERKVPRAANLLILRNGTPNPFELQRGTLKSSIPFPFAGKNSTFQSVLCT
eukprot:GGOE01048552.1.p2 GENE.GGOE01048552.1~~GGOE01048552.1.p2  ORF type:complete len:116 (-),score=1.49 GGOE01048552.1:663-1010(-)